MENRMNCPNCKQPMTIERYLPDHKTVWWCSDCQIGIPISEAGQ